MTAMLGNLAAMTTEIQSATGTRGAVAAAVRAELARAQVDVADLPALVGRSNSYWSRRVNGHTALDVDDLFTLARLLGISVGVFFGLTDPGPGRPPRRHAPPVTPAYADVLPLFGEHLVAHPSAA